MNTDGCEEPGLFGLPVDPSFRTVLGEFPVATGECVELGLSGSAVDPSFRTVL